MSFQRKPKIIEFPDENHELHGLVVKARRPSIQAIEAVYAMQTGTEKDIMAQVDPLIDNVFGPALLSWNYCDEEGYPVPATPEGLRQIDAEALLYILSGWTEDANAVPTDLGKESSGGRSSQGPSSIPVTGTPGLSNALESLHALPASSPFSAHSPVTP